MRIQEDFLSARAMLAVLGAASGVAEVPHGDHGRVIAVRLIAHHYVSPQLDSRRCCV